MMPAPVSLIERMDQSEAVESVLRLPHRAVVHGGLDGEEGELAVLLELHKLEASLLEEQGHDDGCSLDLVGDPHKVGGRQLELVQHLIQL